MKEKVEQKFNLYLLTRKQNDTSPTYDCANSFMICAMSARRARRIASQNASDEGEEVWIDSEKSSCNEVIPEKKWEGILICDFHCG